MSKLIKILKEDYERKSERNPNYSLRSYARWLGISHTSLTLFLNGKRGLSLNAKNKIATRLGSSPEQTADILGNVRNGDAVFTEIDLEKMHVVSDWFYFAVLSLLEIKGFKEDPTWIAKRLNITTAQAELALGRLESLGLAIRSKRGRLEPSGISFKTPDQMTSLAVRRSHYQSLELAKASLDSHALEKRSFSAMTMAIDPERLPEAKRRIKNFRRKLCHYLEGGRKKEVYRLSVQLFALSGDVSI